MAKTALILEGGGYRGIYPGGVLDVLLENGIDRFSSVWGVSAGAMNGGNYIARQHGRTMRVMLAFRDDPRLMSLYSLVRNGNITNPDFMYDEIQNCLDPFDNETFNASPLPLYVVATDVVFGGPAYLRVAHMPEDLPKVQASASLPGISQIVEVDGVRLLDGGTADSVPFAVALGLDDAKMPAGYEPADQAVVVLTQDRAYRKPLDCEKLAIRTHRYDKYPYFLDALKTRGQRYNDQREQLFELEKQGKLLVIAPERPVTVGVAEKEGAPLLDLYFQGRNQTLARLDEIRAFISA